MKNIWQDFLDSIRTLWRQSFPVNFVFVLLFTPWFWFKVFTGQWRPPPEC